MFNACFKTWVDSDIVFTVRKVSSRRLPFRVGRIPTNWRAGTYLSGLSTALHVEAVYERCLSISLQRHH
jgi:hypothetical protein